MTGSITRSTGCSIFLAVSIGNTSPSCGALVGKMVFGDWQPIRLPAS